VYANRLRNEKIISNPEMFKKYGNTIKNEFGIRTLEGQQLDFNKEAQEWQKAFETKKFDWEKGFETKKFDYQKARDAIEFKFKEDQAKIQNAFTNRQITGQEAQDAFNRNMAIKNFNLAAAKLHRAVEAVEAGRAVEEVVTHPIISQLILKRF